MFNVQCLFILHCHEVWIQRGGPMKKSENQENTQDSRTREKKTRKVSPVLGIIQKVAARSRRGFLQCAQVHGPSQVLPKARSYHIIASFNFGGCIFWRIAYSAVQQHVSPGEHIYHSGSTGAVVAYQWGQVQRTLWRTRLLRITAGV